MTETTRRHERVTQVDLKGDREDVALGSILWPTAQRNATTLVLHFHGARWLAEQSARKALPKAAILAVEAGSGSRVYGERVKVRPDVEQVLRRPWKRVVVSSFSAGYGAVRELLRDPEWRARIDTVVLADSLHAGRDSEPEDLGAFLEFAKTKRLLIVHSEVYPGTYCSTTETADWLIQQMGLRRKAILKWGPLGMQQLSTVKQGQFEVWGFAGNSAPDHVDQLYALPKWIRRVK
jgi:hypothetical protein